MLYDIPAKVKRTEFELMSLPEGEGYEPILAWRLRWLPWCDVTFDDLTIAYMPPEVEPEVLPGEVTCASLATLLHEFGHILEAGSDRVFYSDYNLNDLMDVEWTFVLPETGPWSRFELNKHDKNRAILSELNVMYLVYDVLYRTFPDKRKEDLQILFYDDPESFQPEYWQGVIDTVEGYDTVPAWARELSERMWKDHEPMMTDLVNALRDALNIRRESRGYGNREKVSGASG